MRWGLLFLLGLLAPTYAMADPNNGVEIIKPPVPVFPSTPYPGRCDVSFDLIEYDKIVINQVRCTAQIFCASAREAVQETQLRVIDVAGTREPGVRRVITYPLTFVFDDQSVEELAWVESFPLQPCTGNLVS